MMPRIRVPRAFAAAIGMMLIVSCQNPVCGCPPAVAEAVLYGRVTDPAGNPVAGATLSAQEGSPGCEHTAGIGWTATDAAGRYRTLIHTPMPHPECLRAFALPPAGSLLRGSDTVPFQVRFDYDKVVDSARVDLVLRAR